MYTRLNIIEEVHGFRQIQLFICILHNKKPSDISEGFSFLTQIYLDRRQMARQRL
jgi:hypothetical protein